MLAPTGELWSFGSARSLVSLQLVAELTLTTIADQ